MPSKIHGIVVVRNGEVKIRLPWVEPKADGTLWHNGIPLLGVTDPAEAKTYTAAVKAGRFSEIPAAAFTRLGENDNGLWVGTGKEWDERPEKRALDQKAAVAAEEKAKVVRIFLSSRGWGDYSACEWTGDITRSDGEILAECRAELAGGHDVDRPNQTDDELLAKIVEAREKWRTRPERLAAARKAEDEDLQKKIDSGFCFSCETWCHGDCGSFSNDPKTKFARDLKRAQAEGNYGIED